MEGWQTLTQADSQLASDLGAQSAASATSPCPYIQYPILLLLYKYKTCLAFATIITAREGKADKTLILR